MFMLMQMIKAKVATSVIKLFLILFIAVAINLVNYSNAYCQLRMAQPEERLVTTSSYGEIEWFLTPNQVADLVDIKKLRIESSYGGPMYVQTKNFKPNVFGKTPTRIYYSFTPSNQLYAVSEEFTLSGEEAESTLREMLIEACGGFWNSGMCHKFHGTPEHFVQMGNKVTRFILRDNSSKSGNIYNLVADYSRNHNKLISTHYVINNYLRLFYLP